MQATARLVSVVSATLSWAQEFVALTRNPESSYVEADEFSRRLTSHIRTERLRGMDDMIWRANAFSEQKKNQI